MKIQLIFDDPDIVSNGAYPDVLLINLIVTTLLVREYDKVQVEQYKVLSIDLP